MSDLGLDRSDVLATHNYYYQTFGPLGNTIRIRTQATYIEVYQNVDVTIGIFIIHPGMIYFFRPKYLNH